MERDPRLSLPDLEAEERATYYTARSVPVDSAALYEAVNAWVDAIQAELQMTFADPAISKPKVQRAYGAVLYAAMTLARSRYERRRSQQTEAWQ